jgi:hypothetical protein
MAGLRNSLSNEDRNRLRNELANSIKSDNSKPSQRSTTIGGSVDRAASRTSRISSGDDLRRLKAFFSSIALQNRNISIFRVK